MKYAALISILRLSCHYCYNLVGRPTLMPLVVTEHNIPVKIMFSD